VQAQVERKVHELGLRGIRSLAVAKSNDAGDWVMQVRSPGCLPPCGTAGAADPRASSPARGRAPHRPPGWPQGILTFLDPPRPDTKDTLERAMAYGVDVKMITGAPPGLRCALGTLPPGGLRLAARGPLRRPCSTCRVPHG
jgi:magnesium-transporting ATPase (P-type)